VREEGAGVDGILGDSGSCRGSHVGGCLEALADASCGARSILVGLDMPPSSVLIDCSGSDGDVSVAARWLSVSRSEIFFLATVRLSAVMMSVTKRVLWRGC
jgi:hypothetical protein